MGNLESNKLGWLTAILLSLVTLFVFGSLQNYGPESAVRRFHASAAELDMRDAAKVATPDFSSDSTQQLWTFVSSLLADRHASYQIVSYNRQRDRAVIVVRYAFPSNQATKMVWVANRVDNRWFVDTRDTVLAARYLLSP